MPVAGVSRPVTVPTKPVDLNYGAYLPSKITMYRDGGTIKMEGLVNRSYSANIRFDGAIGSPTRGTFFVAPKFFAGPAMPEKPMKKADLQELQQGLKRYVKDHPNAEPAYSILLKNIDKALGKGNVKLPTAAHLKNVLGAWEFHHANFTLKKPTQLKDSNILKSYTLSKPPAGMVGGTTMKAYVLKDQPEKVIFEKNVGGRPFYFGPVSHIAIPK